MPERLSILAIVAVLAGCTEQPADTGNATGIRFLSEPVDSQDFQRADSVREFEFPRDHGMHPGFATEWWYFTGNLWTQSNRRFGFELTFFRYALSATNIERESGWGSNQVWLAHFALTDELNQRFYMDERMGRGALDIAGAASDEFRVHVRDWSAARAQNRDSLRLEAGSDQAAISLELTQVAPISLHGDSGLDQKSAATGNASYYYSIPRLAAAGTVQLAPDQEFAVTGTTWLDREWATSSLDEGVEGWDWFGLQLDDGTNLMLYRLRNTDGSLNEFSTGTVMDEDGSNVRLDANDVQYEATDYWTSSTSAVRYPIAWRVSIPRLELELHVRALIENQEFNVGLRYWEGAVDITGTRESADITGVGYLELAGYQ